MEYPKRFLRRNIAALAVILFGFVFYSFTEEEWKIRKSTHFIVRYKNCSDSFLYKLVDQAEDAYREVTQELRFFRDEPWLWDKRALIYVFDTKDDYLSHTQMPAWSTGCARPFEKTVYTYSESYEFFKYTLTHELAHLIFREFVGKVSIPLWLDEGVAVYMERRRESSSMEPGVRKLVRENLYIPFNEFLYLNFEDLDKQRGPDKELRGLDFVGRYYLQSFSIVYFLIQKYDNYKFTRLLRKLKSGKGVNEAFLDTYGAFRDIEDFEEQWRKFYR